MLTKCKPQKDKSEFFLGFFRNNDSDNIILHDSQISEISICQDLLFPMSSAADHISLTDQR